MIVNNLEQGSPEWHEFRKKKISGTRLKDLYSARAWTKESLVAALDLFEIEYPKTTPRKEGAVPQPKETVGELEKRLTPEVRMYLLRNAPKKIEFYELLADHLGIEPDDEDRMDRGLRLEEEALDMAKPLIVAHTEDVREFVTVGCCVSEVDPRIINSPDKLIKIKSKFKEAVEIKCLSRARHLQAIVENVVPDEFESQKLQYFIVNPDLEILWFVFYDPRVTCKPFHVIKVTRESLGNKPQEYMEFQLAQLKDIDKLVEELSF